MLNEPTMQKLHGLKLTAFATAWTEQQKNHEMAKLSFDERLGLLIDAEWLHRENARLNRRTREAKLRISSACVEGIDYPARRELDKSVIRQLASCRWVEEHQNVVITGATGTGKTYVACALAHAACRKGFRALYRRASRLFDEFLLARAKPVRLVVSGPSDAEEFGANMVPNGDHPSETPAHPRSKSARRNRKISGPSWIRTRDQSVMSRQL